jgi:hypothetical protein
LAQDLATRTSPCFPFSVKQPRNTVLFLHGAREATSLHDFLIGVCMQLIDVALKELASSFALACFNPSQDHIFQTDWNVFAPLRCT